MINKREREYGAFFVKENETSGEIIETLKNELDGENAFSDNEKLIQKYNVGALENDKNYKFLKIFIYDEKNKKAFYVAKNYNDNTLEIKEIKYI